jgi:hypothetical protein
MRAKMNSTIASSPRLSANIPCVYHDAAPRAGATTYG